MVEQLKNPLIPAKRGRPSKTAPVVVDGVTVITGEEKARIRELVTGIESDGDKARRLMMSALEKHFELGKIIDGIIPRLNAGKAASAALIAEYTQIPVRQVNLDLKIFKQFKDKPELMANITMREVTAMISDGAEKRGGREDSTGERVQYMIPAGQLQFNEESFGLPPLSGVAMDTYRVQLDKQNGTLYLLQKGAPSAVPLGTLTVETPKDAAMQDAYERLMSETQCAVERYYAVIEQERRREDGAA